MSFADGLRVGWRDVCTSNGVDGSQAAQKILAPHRQHHIDCTTQSAHQERKNPLLGATLANIRIPIRPPCGR
eukprot:7639091-Pyramimonas_sp.AAC.1